MKKAITTFALAAIMTLGSTFANAGIIVAGYADTQPTCTETQSEGIIVAGYTGIIVAGFTGIIVAGYKDTSESVTATRETPCTDKQSEGIIVAG